MEYSFDLQMAQMHGYLAWAGVIVFVLRGIASQSDALKGYEGYLRILMFGIWVLLAVTGLSLWYLFRLNPSRDAWLLIKLVALVAYGYLAHRAFGLENFRVISWGLGLALLAYLLALSITRSPGLGVF